MSIIKEKITHESYGVCSFNRFMSTQHNYFGSDVENNTGIELRIHFAKMYMSDCSWENHVYPEKEIVTVRMTNTQFADLISGFNVGEGVPCTIESVNGKQIEYKPYDTFDKHVEEFIDDEAAKAYKAYDDIYEMLNSMKISKKDKEKLESLVRQTKPNVRYYRENLESRLNKAMSEMKTSFNSYVRDKLIDKGLNYASIEWSSGMETE